MWQSFVERLISFRQRGQAVQDAEADEQVSTARETSVFAAVNVEMPTLQTRPSVTQRGERYKNNTRRS